MIFNSPYKQLDRKVNTWCNYTTRLDTYGKGCQHDCKYCYAKSLLSFRGMWNVEEPASALIGEIYYRIKRLETHSIVRIGGMTDCFQPIEIKSGITYETIKLLNRFKIHYLIVTKSSLVADDKYCNIYDPELSHFQITITSTDNKTALEYEKASLISNRIKAIEKLQRLNFDVSIRLSPLIESNVNFSIVNKIKCNKILIEFLKVNHNVKKWFDINYAEYEYKSGGFSHLRLEKKILLLRKIKGIKEISVGEYVREHHEYFKNNVNFNPEDCCNLNYKRPKISKQLSLAF